MELPADFCSFKRVRPDVRRSVFRPRVSRLLIDLLVLLDLLVFLLFNLVLVGSISVPIFFVEKCWKLARRTRELLAPWFAHPARCWATLVENQKRKKQEHWLRELRHWLSM